MFLVKNQLTFVKRPSLGQLKLFSVLCMLLFVVTACEKDKDTEPILPEKTEYELLQEKFFGWSYVSDNNPNVFEKPIDPDVHLVEDVRQVTLAFNTPQEDLEYHMGTIGYPIWDHGKGFEGEYGDVVLVPYSKLDDTSIRAVLFGLRQKGDRWRLFLNWSENHFEGVLDDRKLKQVYEDHFNIHVFSEDTPPPINLSISEDGVIGRKTINEVCVDQQECLLQARTTLDDSQSCTWVTVSSDCYYFPSPSGGSSWPNGGGYTDPHSGTAYGDNNGSSTGGSSGSTSPSLSPEETVQIALGSFYPAFDASEIDWMIDNLDEAFPMIDNYLDSATSSSEAVADVKDYIWLCQNFSAFYNQLPEIGSDGAASLAVDLFYGEVSAIVPQLNLSFDEIVDMYRGETENGIATCENCSQYQKEILNDAHQEALDMIKCTSNLLKDYNELSPTFFVSNALKTNYGGTCNQALADYLSLMFDYVGWHLYNQGYKTELNGEGFCSSSTIAWSYPAIHFTKIRLCDPAFFNSSSREQAGTIIHESFHLNYIAGDWAYDWEAGYSQLNTIQQLTNADSFSELAKTLCP